MVSYLLLQAYKGVQNRRFWQSLAANGRRVAEYHLHLVGWVPSQQAKYNASCTKVQVSRRSSGAGVYRVRPCAGYGRCLFDSRPRALRRMHVAPWAGRILFSMGVCAKGGCPRLVFIAPFRTKLFQYVKFSR